MEHQKAREIEQLDPLPVASQAWRDMMDKRQTTGPFLMDNDGAVFLCTDGFPLYVTKESVLNAKPIKNSLGEDGAPNVLLLWIKGHNRPTSVRSTWEEFQAWRFDLYNKALEV